MVRIKNTPQIKDKKGIILANDILVKAPNGKMFINESKMQDDNFLQSVIIGDVEIIGGKIPKVWVQVPYRIDVVNEETGEKVIEDGKVKQKNNPEYADAIIDEKDNKRYKQVPITEVKKEDVYKKEAPYKKPVDPIEDINKT